jgi:hypothetical protein
MADRIPRICRQYGCFERTRDRSGFCAAHATSNYVTDARKRFDHVRAKDPVWRLYNHTAWRRFKASLSGNGNVLCQRIENGRRCNRLVEIWHHIISPKVRPDLMYTASNVVGVCRQHHPTTEGEPPENLGRLAEIYIPTVWNAPRFF